MIETVCENGRVEALRTIGFWFNAKTERLAVALTKYVPVSILYKLNLNKNYISGKENAEMYLKSDVIDNEIYTQETHKNETRLRK